MHACIYVSMLIYVMYVLYVFIHGMLYVVACGLCQQCCFFVVKPIKHSKARIAESRCLAHKIQLALALHHPITDLTTAETCANTQGYSWPKQRNLKSALRHSTWPRLHWFHDKTIEFSINWRIGYRRVSHSYAKLQCHKISQHSKSNPTVSKSFSKSSFSCCSFATYWQQISQCACRI